MLKTNERVRAWVAAAGAVVAGLMGSGTGVSTAPPDKSITLTPIGVFRAGTFDSGGAEIAAYDPATRRLFTVNLNGPNGGADGTPGHFVDIIDISTPSAPTRVYRIDVTAWGNQANSVSVHDGILAVAIEATPKTSPGRVAFFNAYGALLSVVTVGALPDMLTFTPNGQYVLVANEGEPNSYGLANSVDPDGTVSIIDMRGDVRQLTDADVTTLDFSAYNGTALDPSIRIFGPGATVAQDLEPEYVAISHDSQTAWVTLQENNALAIVDIRSRTITSLVGLGFKDHSRAGNGFDASDRDSQSINIVPRQVWGMYQPDGIAAFEHKGQTFLVTANEGDVREWPGLPGGSEAVRVGSLTLDATTFPNGAALKNNASLGRLNVTLFNGNTDADSAFEQLYSFGARSFSVWDAAGRQIFDSGDAIERITAQRLPALFNSTHTNNLNTDANPNNWTRDSRSDDKGPEPEGVTIARLFGRQFAFIVLERIGGVMIYELTDPAAPVFVDYINTRVLNAPVNSAAAEDLGPEGVFVISEDDSPNGKPLLVVANEISGTTRIYEISKIK
ncbi:MAG TPA: choice-of-anchor I family protein [Vicinamibacterales bacterium]|nr:choice-of-anchor I family protein [Vicinamibacterales bacterium]